MPNDVPVGELMDRLADVCARAADVFLKGPAPAPADAVPPAPWAAERQILAGELGTTEPSSMIAEATSTYLAEAAHQVRAIAQLLRTRAVVASLDPLARAVLERAGRVKWMLDPTASPKDRGARAGLELAVSLQHYRETLARIGADEETRRPYRDMNTVLREQINTWYEVDREPDDPCDPGSKPTNDISRWRLEGQAFLGLSRGVQHALTFGNTSASLAAATYAGVSGFSHPSILFAREHRTIGDQGEMTFTYTKADLEKVTRLAAFGFLEAVRYWATYYGADSQRLAATIDALHEELGAFSVLAADDQDRGGSERQ